MIMWTEQGKVWKFPINNEQGLDEEFQTDFSEHVLLEMYLEDWCPTSGPIRHFMELVCVGLSNNHYLSAKEKRDHIFWYRDYFESKRDFVGELLDIGKNSTSNPSTSVEGGQKQLES
jgi:small subunit ribosomal protein S31